MLGYGEAGLGVGRGEEGAGIGGVDGRGRGSGRLGDHSAFASHTTAMLRRLVRMGGMEDIRRWCITTE